ncbi:hypothetical protein BDB00DRAFT_209534 [Zychaea mexicana]|uniref:uncharacterized protein n=1 Tax=Zychaea mexicana TaxID=64656 RepID=UPI0022FE1D2C|nr:uncharacterized protein BDB00DRAFT_209534 [Zychaea mexicana]KAI9495665.1 hypothetical protein BDB00DRAFT_209534 [Zychaea mexicana]
MLFVVDSTLHKEALFMKLVRPFGKYIWNPVETSTMWKTFSTFCWNLCVCYIHDIVLCILLSSGVQTTHSIKRLFISITPQLAFLLLLPLSSAAFDRDFY